MTKGKILVVDDEASICQIIETRLRMAGYDVATTTDGDEALKLLHSFNPDLIVLDIIMPGTDGLQVCQEIRKEMMTPIIILTAKSDVNDRIAVLELGADDYMVKPFSPRELEARVKAVLRRSQIDQPKQSPLRIDSLVIDSGKRQVLKHGQKVKLTEMEFNLLELLSTNPGRLYSRSEILQQVWGYRINRHSDTRVVDVHISRLRSKLEEDPANPEFILTTRGTGYMFQNYVTEDDSQLAEPQSAGPAKSSEKSA